MTQVGTSPTYQSLLIAMAVPETKTKYHWQNYPFQKVFY